MNDVAVLSAPAVAFDNSYARLPARFFAALAPTPVAAPRLIRLNDGLAAELGLDAAALRAPEGVAMLAGNLVPAAAAPLAMAYAGHQFGNFVPQLGDGRAILLGEVVGPDGVRRDIQLKGAGRTPFSRGGDGRAALGPVLREYLVSEAMAALGIPTTRSLAAVLTGEEVFRDLPLAGAVLTRVARSHVRVGTFQFFAARNDGAALRTLADYIIARNYPDAAGAENPYLTLLEAVIARTAALIASWQLVGFIHGVMNTDNMSVAGETIDYGPCAFMDSFHPGTVYSSIDHAGRYAYGNQPRIALWNLTRLAETLLSLLADDEDAAIARAQAALERFAGRFDAAYQAGLREKLGLHVADDGDIDLARALFAAMAEHQADFTLTFRYLSDSACGGPELDEKLRAVFAAPEAFDAWAINWRARLAQEGGPNAARGAAMRAVNPAVIPRNHQVQAAIVAAQDDDFSKFAALADALSRPFDDQPEYMLPPRPEQVVRQTFCGT
jgi:uncharacterized protein YdiU (UPF0061 family)